MTAGHQPSASSSTTTRRQSVPSSRMGRSPLPTNVAGTAEVEPSEGAVTWKLDDVQFASNGSHGTRDTSATMPTLTAIAIGGAIRMERSLPVLVYGWTIYDDHYPTDAGNGRADRPPSPETPARCARPGAGALTMANVKAYFSCLKPTANKWARLSDRLATRQVEFVVLNEIAVGQDVRILLSILGGRNDLALDGGAVHRVESRPKVIAAFRADNGRKLRGYPVDRVEWRRVAPDVQTGVNEQGEPVYGRPPLNDFRQVHGWLRHPMDDEQDED